MERSAIAWTLTLCLAIIGWLIWDVQFTTGINFDIHHYLIDKQTNTTKKPIELFNVTQILNQTQRYIDETNSIERLHDLEYSLNAENPYYIDQIYSRQSDLKLSGWPVSNKEKCARQLEWMLREYESFNDTNYALIRGRRGYEFAQLFGSIGKPESGTYASGTTTWLGSYDRCQRLVMNQDWRDPKEEKFKMRYCWSRLRPKWWPANETIYPPTVIRVGVCLPESCDTQIQTIYANKIDRLIKLDWPKFYQDNLLYESMFCLPDERSPLRQVPQSGRYFLHALAIWLLLILGASLSYELIRRRRRHGLRCNQSNAPAIVSSIKKDLESKQNNHQCEQVIQEQSLLLFPTSLRYSILEALSIHNSLKQFKTHRFKFQYKRLAPHERPRVDLSCFDSFKVMMALLIVLGHGAYMGTAWSRSLANRVDMNTGFFGTFTQCIGRFVDTFFIFFGVLTSYNILRKFSNRQLGNPLVWLGINLGILLRIGPVFVLTYCYARLIAPYTAASPWWDYGVMRYSMRGACMSDSWLKAIPYFGCLGSPAISPCVMPAWFIVSYSQISLILPLITYIIIKLPNRLSQMVLMAFLGCISALQFALKLNRQTTIDAKSFTLYGGFIVDLLEKFQSSGQLSTLGRIGCVSVGCYIGYLLRCYEIGQIQQWPGWLRSKLVLIATIITSLIIILLPTIGYFVSIYTQRTADSMSEIILVNSICVFIWPIINAILIICSTSIYNHIAPIRFFAHSFWHSFNKLGLCIYLIHWEVLVYGLTSYEQGPSSGYVIDQVKLWTFGSVFTIIFAIFVHILFEAPLTQLLMILSQKFFATNRTSQPKQTIQSKPVTLG